MDANCAQGRCCEFPARASAVKAMDAQRARYLEAMGIQLWQRRDSAPAAVESSAEGVAAPPTDTIVAHHSERLPPSAAQDAIALLDWSELQARVAQCQQCEELVANRSQTVFGVGNRNAQWLVIGEAPGAEEDQQGEPFVGRAGQLLNAMLLAVGLRREQVYIANILKCRPPNNRDPKAEEAARCAPFLQRQIALIQPQVILAVGRIAAQQLLASQEPIGRLRGHPYRYADIPLVVTYHPAYLLRSPSEKRKAWEDLKLARALVAPT